MALTVDTSVAGVTTAAGTVTTAAFTAAANTLILALNTYDSRSSDPAVSGSMSDTAGLSWTLAIRKNAVSNGNIAGSVEVWWAITTGGFTSQTITTTNSSGITNSQATELRVVQFQGYNAASPLGAVVGTDFSAQTANYLQAITTTADNSWVWGKLMNYTRLATLTANGSSVILGQGDDGDGDQYATFAQSSVSTAPTATSGTNLTLGGTFPGSAFGHIVCVEVMPALPAVTIPLQWVQGINS